MKALGHQNFIVRTDSKVVRDHIEKNSEARKPELIEYLDAVRSMEKYFKGFDIIHIPRHMNDEADKLTKVASRKEQLPSDVFFEEITEPSVKPKKEKQVSNISAEDWRAPIMEYLRGNIELPNEKEKKMFQRARGYVISEGELFNSGVTSCKDRWTKRGGELGLFQISKTIKTTLTYAKLVRLNSPTG